jgi:hypothetical protein
VYYRLADDRIAEACDLVRAVLKSSLDRMYSLTSAAQSPGRKEP